MLKLDPAYLKSFEAASNGRSVQDERYFQLLQQSSAATFALYDYAAAHSKEITVTNSELHFSSGTVRAEFNRQFEASKSLHEQLQNRLSELTRKRQEARKSLGIVPKS